MAQLEIMYEAQHAIHSFMSQLSRIDPQGSQGRRHPSPANTCCNWKITATFGRRM